MSQKTYILCPGQGAQQVAMGKDYFDNHEPARKIFNRANEVLGFDLASLCFTGPEDRLNQTDISQPAIYTTSVACYQAALAAGTIQLANITAWAGLSLGEYTALHLAGVFSFEEGLKLVAARGRFMQEAALAVPSGMVALAGAVDETIATQLCQQAAPTFSRPACGPRPSPAESAVINDVLVPANFNAPGQIVVSGSLTACQRILPLAEAAGLKAIPLKVAGAFHSPLMQPAADRMAAELAKVTFATPRQSVYANVTAALHQDANSIKKLLIDQIVKPVRWEQTMQTLLAAGDARWIELAPGRVLTGLLKRINRRLPVDSLATADMLTAATPQS